MAKKKTANNTDPNSKEFKRNMQKRINRVRRKNAGLQGG
jgi:hypothetical protein